MLCQFDKAAPALGIAQGLIEDSARDLVQVQHIGHQYRLAQ